MSRRPLLSLSVPVLALVICLAASSHVQAAKGEGGPPIVADESAVVHALNRLGYGPRPGDVERVGELGLEAYIAPGSRFQKDGGRMKDASYHLTLLAQNTTGVRSSTSTPRAGPR